MEDNDNRLISILLNFKREKLEHKEQSDVVIGELHALAQKEMVNQKEL